MMRSGLIRFVYAAGGFLEFIIVWFLGTAGLILAIKIYILVKRNFMTIK